MRKIFVVFAAFFAAAILCAPSEASDGKLKIMATIFPQYDFARQIAGDSAEVSMLLRPGSESHSFDPTPRDIKRVAESDLFIYVGGESDEWVRRILDSMPPENKKRMRVVALTDIISMVEEKLVDGMQEEEEEEEGEEPEYDEHVWTSPKNAEKIVAALADVICEMDPPNAKKYRANADAYIGRLDKIDKRFEEIVSGAKRRTMIFGDRFPFRYFADAYGLDYYAAFPGCATETEANASTIAFLIDKTKSEKIPVIFHIEFSNESIARAISESTGAKNMLLHSCHNISRENFDAGVTYADLMERNTAALSEALNGELGEVAK
jgi:zinc transport system substrate-binding protein